MSGSKVHFIWKDPGAPREFRTGVSLHGHTLHAQECLSFLPRYLHRVPVLSAVVRRYQRPGPGRLLSRLLDATAYSSHGLSPGKGADRAVGTSAAGFP